jgi:glutathione synthase/RimK-type ligase-like ATP-grasp enzyme
MEAAKKILVCGSSDEAPVSMLIRSLDKIHAPYIVIDQKELHKEVKLRWQVDDHGISGQMKIRDQVLHVNDILSVYHRFVEPEDFFDPGVSQQLIQQSRSILRAMMELFDILDARIVNLRRPMMSNNSKPYQSLLIKRAGFSIPETCITNDRQALVKFRNGHPSLIYKSISSVRSIVSELDRKSISRIGSLRALPTQFQEKIDGFNVRVHVIGKETFATKIITASTDYRYAAKEGQPAAFRSYTLTDELKDKCVKLARICHLDFAGIDLIINPEKTYCLEVNPSPGYSYYQEATGQPIADALANYLAEAKRG